MSSEQSQNENRPRRAVGLFLIKVLSVLFLSCLAAVGYLMLRSHDPFYVLRELRNWSDYRRFDKLIVKAGKAHNVDPRLIKAVVWRESRFQADMIGRHGERGLMQVSEVAARDWAEANGVADFRPDQLLRPQVNLEVGTWYLAKAVQRWTARDDAVPFALAEYNAGKTRVDRWIREASQKVAGKPVTAQIFTDSIDFPSTARYVRTILTRYDFYKRRGPLRIDSSMQAEM
jgi:soluble lytic murein transglycosylase